MTLTRAEFQDLFGRQWTTAWRWECQGTYAEPSEDEPFRKFLAGEPEDLSWFQNWVDRVGAWTEEGRRMSRVRMLTDPLTDYLRFELSITPVAIDAGEDIRFLPEGRAAELGAPKTDYWMFDEQTVVLMSFGDHGVNGADLVTGADAVRPYIEWRDIATEAASPYTALRL
jgi:hypothetical protein